MDQDAAFHTQPHSLQPSATALMIFFAIANLLLGAVSVLVTSLVLSFASAIVFGTVITIGGTGMLAGSLAMTAWGRAKTTYQWDAGFHDSFGPVDNFGRIASFGDLSFA